MRNKSSNILFFIFSKEAIFPSSLHEIYSPTKDKIFVPKLGKKRWTFLPNFILNPQQWQFR